MKIRLTRNYRGSQTNGALIPAGEYEAGDKALHGIDPAYLVKIGVAEDITPAPPPKKTTSRKTAKSDDSEE